MAMKTNKRAFKLIIINLRAIVAGVYYLNTSLFNHAFLHCFLVWLLVRTGFGGPQTGHRLSLSLHQHPLLVRRRRPCMSLVVNQLVLLMQARLRWHIWLRLVQRYALVCRAHVSALMFHFNSRCGCWFLYLLRGDGGSHCGRLIGTLTQGLPE